MSNTRLVNGMVDYFTVTALRQHGDKLWSQARRIVEEIDKELNPKNWRFFGYEGVIYSDPAIGHFAWGESPNSDQMGVIVQASGTIAKMYVGRFFLSESRFSRVDLAADVHLGTRQPGLAKVCYEWLINQNDQGRKISFVSNNLGGETLYINSRQSDQFGRLYDKGVETTLLEPGIRYRYEVEFKRRLAKDAAAKLGMLMAEGRSFNNAILATVYDWFASRNVEPIYQRANAPSLDIRASIESKTDERKLIWLRKSVSPTVKDLILRGNRDVLDALGITDLYIVKRRVPDLDIYQP